MPFAADGGVTRIHLLFDTIFVVGSYALENIEKLIFSLMGMKADAAAGFKDEFCEHFNLLSADFFRSKYTLQFRDACAALKVFMTKDFEF